MAHEEFNKRLQKLLHIQHDDGKYDHRQDPRDVTGLMEADHELQKQMLQLGYVVKWAIDGRWRLTDRGVAEMERRREEILKARRQNSVGPLLPEHEPKEHDDD
jgi:hypothetical protein